MQLSLVQYAARAGRAAFVALLFAAVGALPASAESVTAVDLEEPAPPSTGQVQTLIGVMPAPAVPAEALPAELPPVPERFMEPIGPFTMFMEVLASVSPSENGLLASPGCVTDSVYKRGMKLVYRFEIYDLDNNVRLTSADGSTARVVLPDGQVLPAYFVPRGGPGTDPSTAPWTWVAVWQIPTDYPLGPVKYHIEVATPDGRSDSIEPPSLAGQPVQPDAALVIGGALPTIIP
jgi:hypothetical protein